MKTLRDIYTDETGYMDFTYSDGWNSYFTESYGEWMENKLEPISKHSWISVKDELPDFDKTVWLYFEDTGHVALGVLAYIGGDEAGYCWANYISGSISSDNGRIVADCDYEDIDPSHWIYVPELPPTTKGAQG